MLESFISRALDVIYYRWICVVPVVCILIKAGMSEFETTSAIEPVTVSNVSITAIYFRANNRIDSDVCFRENLDCSLVFGQYCCRDAFGYIRCCTTNNIQPTFKNPSGDHHWLHRLSLWNMWYFWFIVVLIMATCFTGCNYWRRQRRSPHFRLFQRQYTTIAGNGARNSEGNGGTQLVIPITMYEVSPDTILRLMRENAIDRAATSTLSSSIGYGSPRSYGRHHHHHHLNRQSALHQHERSLLQGPPSYGEVTSKPNKYPPNVDDSEPPSYESVSQSLQRETGAPKEEDENVRASSQHRCSSL